MYTLKRNESVSGSTVGVISRGFLGGEAKCGTKALSNADEQRSERWNASSNDRECLLQSVKLELVNLLSKIVKRKR